MCLIVKMSEKRTLMLSPVIQSEADTQKDTV